MHFNFLFHLVTWAR